MVLVAVYPTGGVLSFTAALISPGYIDCSSEKKSPLYATPEHLLVACRCPLCYECPCCGSALAPGPVSLEQALAPSSSSRTGRSFCLRCLYCQWTSEGAGVVGHDLVDLTEVAAAAAAREKEGGDGGGAAIIDALVKAAKQREAAAAANARGGARLRAGSSGGGIVAGAAAGGSTTTTSLFSASSGGAGASATGPWKVCYVRAGGGKWQISTAS